MNRAEKDLPLMTTVDDETYDELMALVEQRIVHIALWEDSLADGLADRPADSAAQDTFDIDLYLEDGVYFELYGVACFDDPDAEAWNGLATTGERLATLVKSGARLNDIAVDEDDGLILVIGASGGQTLYLAVGAWLLAEWDELPE
ncbi:MAG: hypothetical protein BroJett021_08640 [Chloroflexota bacterium]|jgi:hypothetical protein|nr:hypothetical protein [Caldilinea sp.]GIK71876.1 MAG: hypothetical protein BroJett021_08640 [Chloroflexota bacterium]